MFDLSRQGSVYVLTMNAGENRFNRDSVAALNAALGERQVALAQRGLNPWR